jgi:hypothetical protein
LAPGFLDGVAQGSLITTGLSNRALPATLKLPIQIGAVTGNLFLS